MLPTHESVDHLAGRIEEAYRLRRPVWWRGCSTTRVWHTAALRLWEAHATDPALIPLDAELFVASQQISASLSDPWTEIAHSQAGKRYRSIVRRIVRQLRAELRREVAVAERSIRGGIQLDSLLSRKSSRISSLGSYILARRAGRDDLAERFAQGAAAQHVSCPLYRIASLPLIPADYYPDENLAVEVEKPSSHSRGETAFASHRKHRDSEN